VAKTLDVGLAGEPSFAKATDGGGRVICIIQPFAKGGERGGGVLAVGLGADGRSKSVVEVRSALRRRNRVTSSDVRLVDELLVAAPDKGQAVPEEGLGCGAGRGAPLLGHPLRGQPSAGGYRWSPPTVAVASWPSAW